ncbi:hypothetical protein KAR91_03365 [Candidatus Pacearchaeota archaeon]|nr:hypothetical protein [Candidatus Pacearchaeota archaeon]
MKDLSKIINEVKQCETEDFKPSDDAILISATQILLSKPVSKPAPSKPSNGGKYKIKNPTAPASDAQKGALDKRGIKYPEEINMGEASKLIEENPEVSSEM